MSKLGVIIAEMIAIAADDMFTLIKRSPTGEFEEDGERCGPHGFAKIPGELAR